MITRFEITKLHGEVVQRPQRRLEVKNQFSITQLEADPQGNPGFLLSFRFVSVYNEQDALLEVEGKAFMITSKERARKVKEHWEANRLLPEEEMLTDGNVILHRVQMLAILLAHELGLQSPLRLPVIEAKQPAQSEKQDA